MSKTRTHYDNLQVKESASIEVIKGAYRYLSQKWHPDKNPNNREEAERFYKIINEAYETLSDPVKRAKHDAWILRQKEVASELSNQSPPRNHSRQEREEPKHSDQASATYQAGIHFAKTIRNPNIPISTKLGYISAHIFRHWWLYGMVFLVLAGILR